MIEDGTDHECHLDAQGVRQRLATLKDARNAYVTTSGRHTGREYEIEIWFATDGTTIWLLSGGGDRADWVQNLLARPETHVRIDDVEFKARARLPLSANEEKATAARLLADKYAGYFTKAFDEGYVVALDPAAGI